VKPKPLILSASVGDGKLEVSDSLRRQLASALKRWPNTPVEIEIRPWEETRRSQANRYYWGVVLKFMAEESGHTVDELHELMKLRHNSKVVADPTTGEEVKIACSTSKLTINEFSDYLEAVMLDGSEHLGIVFPEPRKAEDWREPRRAA
jgi:hypothetical protein